MKRSTLMIAAGFIALMFSRPTLADLKNRSADPWAKGAILVGGFFTDMNTELSLGAGALGVVFDAENVLGLDERTKVWRVDAYYRFGESGRHRWYFTWYDLSRNASTVLGQDLEIEDIVIPIGTRVNSFLDLAFYKLAYSYSFLQDDRFDLHIGLGLFLTDIKFGLQAIDIGEDVDEALLAPLPTVRLGGLFAITPKLMLRQSLDFFWLEYKEYKGSIIDLNIGLEYNIWKHFGLGIGYEFFTIEVSAEGDEALIIGDLFGSIEYNYSGIQLYGKLYF